MSDLGGATQFLTYLTGVGSSLHGNGSTNTKGQTFNATNHRGVVQQKTGSETKNLGSTKTETDNTQTGDTKQTTTGKSINTGTDITKNTADAGALQNAKNISAMALKDSVSPGKTSALVDNILGKAAIAFAPTQAQERANGLYGSSTLDLLSGFAKGQATSDAASAVLNYRATEQGIAQSANADVLNATKSTTANTSGTASTNSMSDIASTLKSLTDSIGLTKDLSHTGTESKTGDLSRTAVTGISDINSKSKQDQSGESGGVFSGLSVVCTELHKQGRLDSRAYFITMHHFQGYSNISKKSYYLWAGIATKYLQNNPFSRLARMLSWLTQYRCFHICYKVKPSRYDFTWKGLFSYCVLNSFTFIVGVGFVLIPAGLNNLFNGKKVMQEGASRNV